MGAIERNPKDSMKSTWRHKDWSTWSHQEKMMDVLRAHPTDIKRAVPVHAKTDSMPYVPHSQAHKWVLIHAFWPIIAQEFFTRATGYQVHIAAAAVFYMLAFKANAIHEISLLRELGHQYGHLDGDKHERDQVPDHATTSVWRSLELTGALRPLMCIALTYNKSALPSASMPWLWLPLEIGLYGIVLDFFFYWYHRCMHESDTLWQFHRTHHLTKHPNPLLSLYADGVQEAFDIVGIPLLTWGTMRLMGLPMGFFDWWVCHEYVVFTEIWGHSGLRVWNTPATTATPFLQYFDAELITEDHDLHHRQGWKSSHSYGKQTRLWDRIFGTTTKRIEMSSDNIDWNAPVALRMFW
ncbi:hypothetical protein B0A48_13371 [Cryoendolithus antarcticus]|uniref:Fatty acid hydroxylase domain-containing protein n=1 Tax=Cryoendolithus antarcticus TaxID=1507870 RepID=A0A1V8SQ26_9PEZI|nr:hypothetical protein B0A48_13371 [Cryoendolithus antarcticus]